jgi:hypothetical protein
MRVVNRVGVLVAQLVHNPGHSLVVLRIEGIPDQRLELEGTALALVVELIVERFGDVGVHGRVWASTGRLHVA